MADKLAVRISMIFFGQLKEVIGAESIDVTLPLGSTIGDLITRFEIPLEGNSGIRIAADGNIGAPLDLSLIHI